MREKISKAMDFCYNKINNEMDFEVNILNIKEVYGNIQWYTNVICLQQNFVTTVTGSTKSTQLTNINCINMFHCSV